MSFLLRTLLWIVVVPGAIGCAMAILSRRGSASLGWQRMVVASAVFAAVVVGSWAIVGPPRLVPHDIGDWLPHLAAVGVVAVSVGGSGANRRRWWAVAGCASLVIAYLVIRPLLGVRFGGGHAVLALASGVGTLAAHAGALDMTVRTATARVGVTIALISIITAAAVVTASGTASVGQVGGAAAAGVGGLWLVTIVRPTSIGPASLAISATGWGLVAIGHLYASLSLPIALVALSAPVASAIALRVSRGWPPRRAAIVALVAAGLVAGLAIALAVLAGLPEATDNYGYE